MSGAGAVEGGAGVAAAKVVVLPYEALPFEVQSGFALFEGIEGRPLMGDVRGTPEKELVFVKSGEEGVVISVIDVEGNVARRAFGETEHGPNVVRIAHLDKRDCVVRHTSEVLSVYQFGSDSVTVRTFQLPTDAIVMDFVKLGNAGDEGVVLLGEEGLYIGRFKEEKISWELQGAPTSLYSRWWKLVERERWYRSVAGRCRIVMDVDGDGLDDVFLPDRGRISIYRQEQDGTFTAHGISGPSRWYRTGVEVENYAPRQSEGMSLKSRYLVPYDIVRDPGSGGICLTGVWGDGGVWGYGVRKEGDELSLVPVHRSDFPDFGLLNGSVINRASDWVVFAPHSFRLLWPYLVIEGGRVTGYGDKWRIDINGDGVRDLIEDDTKVSPAGPTRVVSYTLGKPLPEDGGATFEDGSFRRTREALIAKKATGVVTDVAWPPYDLAGSSSVADINGDGALDLVFLQPDIDLEFIVSSGDSDELRECRYTCWLFDKEAEGFTKESRFVFSVRQTLHHETWRRMSAALPEGRRWTMSPIDYGDFDGDGYLDMVLLIGAGKLRVCWNTRSSERPFDMEKVVELRGPGSGGFVAVGTGKKNSVVCWDENWTYSVFCPAVER